MIRSHFPPNRSCKTNCATKAQSGFTLLELCVVIAIIALLVALIFPAVRSARPAARRYACKNNLKQIGIALHNYHDKYGSFPPADTVDENGNRLHSWRTLILPFLGQEPLYNRIDLAKPWDDPVNANAFQTHLPCYSCPNAQCERNHTTYLAVVTRESLIHPSHPKKLSDGIHHVSERLMVIEVDESQAVAWMSPMDGNEATVMAFSPTTPLPHEFGEHGLFADGRVMFFSAEMSRSERENMLSPGEE